MNLKWNGVIWQFQWAGPAGLIPHQCHCGNAIAAALFRKASVSRKLQDNYRSPDCRGWILSCSRSYFASAVAVEDLEWRWFWCLHSRRFRYVSIFGRVVLATSSCWQPVLDRGMNNDQHPKAQNSIKPVMLCIGIANSHVLFWEPADALPSGILIP